MTGPANSGEAKSKVAPYGKGYAWVPVLRSFNKLQNVGVFSYLYYSLAKGHFNGWGFVKAWMAVFSAPKDLDRVKKSLEWFWIIHRLFVCGLCDVVLLP